MGHKDLGESIIQNTEPGKETTDSDSPRRSISATAALVALLPVTALAPSKERALAELRWIILPPSSIYEVERIGWAVSWRLWPPEPVTRVRRVVDSFPFAFKPFSGFLESYVCRAEHPTIYYTLEDIERALSSKGMGLATRVMARPLDRMDYPAWVQSDLKELGLDGRTILAMCQYMPFSGMLAVTESYPECHLNITLHPASIAQRLLNEVVRSVGKGNHDFEFFHRRNVLWFHLPSAYEWWAAGEQIVPTRRKMAHILGGVTWMIRPVQFRCGKTRLWYWGINLEAAAEAGLELP